MTVAIRNDSNAIAELKVPPLQDLGLGNISVNNCKNATFGTKVDCHGNLIVNQYLNLGDPKSEQYDLNNGIINGLIVTDSVAKGDWKQKLLKLKYIWGSLILAVVATAVFCVIFLPEPQEKDNSEDVQLSLNFSLHLQTRHQWSASKPEVDCDSLKIHPAKYVVLGHTVTPACHNPIACQTTMINIQSDHIRRSYCDIGYNFVIAGDGYIYEGIGWGKYGAHTYGFNCDSIGVGFIGNFNIDYPTENMVKLLKLLIEEGLKLNEISSDYKLIAQNQVTNAASPGIHIEELMKEWDHRSLVTKDDYLCE